MSGPLVKKGCEDTYTVRSSALDRGSRKFLSLCEAIFKVKEVRYRGWEYSDTNRAATDRLCHISLICWFGSSAGRGDKDKVSKYVRGHFQSK